MEPAAGDVVSRRNRPSVLVPIPDGPERKATLSDDDRKTVRGSIAFMLEHDWDMPEIVVLSFGYAEVWPNGEVFAWGRLVEVVEAE